MQLLKPTSFDCRAYDLEEGNEYQSLFGNLSKKYDDFFHFLANATGFETVNLKKAGSLYDIQREVSLLLLSQII